jgi:tau tubulin kinase
MRRTSSGCDSPPAAEASATSELTSQSCSILRCGEVLGLRWRVRRALGRGTFSEIYEASDLRGPRNDAGRHPSVAIKVARDQRSCSMLKIEDAVLRELQGTQCPVAIYVELGQGVGPAPPDGAGSPSASSRAGTLYLVMELLGRNVSELRKASAGRRLPMETVSQLGVQMLDALQVGGNVGVGGGWKYGGLCCCRCIM